jgi:hypothetical protein
LRERFGVYIHTIENDRNYGFAEGNNIGIRYALEKSRPDYFLLLNNDTVVDPEFLTELVEVGQGDSLIGILGPKVYFYHQPKIVQSAGGKINWCTGKISLLGAHEIDKGQFDEIKEVEWVSGCALLIKRQVIETIGLLYAGYFAYFEESEWCSRCKKAGYKIVYVPRARLWHKALSTVGKQHGFELYYMTRNQFLFMRRNSTKPQFLSYFIYFFLRDFMFTTGFLLIRRRDLRLLKSFYKGIFDGICMTIKM